MLNVDNKISSLPIWRYILQSLKHVTFVDAIKQLQNGAFCRWSCFNWTVGRWSKRRGRWSWRQRGPWWMTTHSRYLSAHPR